MWYLWSTSVLSNHSMAWPVGSIDWFCLQSLFPVTAVGGYWPQELSAPRSKLKFGFPFKCHLAAAKEFNSREGCQVEASIISADQSYLIGLLGCTLSFKEDQTPRHVLNPEGQHCMDLRKMKGWSGAFICWTLTREIPPRTTSHF